MVTETPRQRSKSSGQGTAADGCHDADDSGDDHADRTSHSHNHDPRPLTSYAGIMASYGVLTAGLILLLRRKRLGVRPLSPWNLSCTPWRRSTSAA